MRTAVKTVCIAVVWVCVTSGIGWSGQPQISPEDIDKLCDIYSNLPITKTIAVSAAHPVPIKPVVVHRCQEIVFKVDRGAATITITDPHISDANQEELSKTDLGAVVMKTLVLSVTFDHPGAPIRVPMDYPNPEKTVFVRYYTECHDLEASQSYECEGSSAPMIIIPPTRP